MITKAKEQLGSGGAPELWAGVWAALPLWLGIVPYGLAFGLLGRTVGLGAAGTMAMSLVVFAGSAQFIALGLLGAGASSVLIVLTTLVVNLRHLLYAASLGPYLRRWPALHKLAAGFLLTDEAYAVVFDRWRAPGARPQHCFYFGVGLCLYGCWNLSTAAGLGLGGLVPDPAALGLHFALPATFIGLLVPLLRTRGAWVTLIMAGAVALLAAGLPGRLDIMLAIIVAASAGWGVDRWGSRC